MLLAVCRNLCQKFFVRPNYSICNIIRYFICYFISKFVLRQKDITGGVVSKRHSVYSLKTGSPIYRKLNLNAVKPKTTVGPLNLEMRELKRFLLNSFTTIPSPMSFSTLSIEMETGIGRRTTSVSYFFKENYLITLQLYRFPHLRSLRYSTSFEHDIQERHVALQQFRAQFRLFSCMHDK